MEELLNYLPNLARVAIWGALIGIAFFQLGRLGMEKAAWTTIKVGWLVWIFFVLRSIIWQDLVLFYDPRWFLVAFGLAIASLFSGEMYYSPPVKKR